MARVSVLLGSLLFAGSALAEPVRLFAAASLTDAVGEAVARFESEHPGIEVVVQLGGSSDLARQILAGAPADLFFSADEAQMNRLRVAMRDDLLSNQLVVVTERERARPLRGPEELESLGRIAMADPEAVPAGVYARRYLEGRGLWSSLREKIVPTLDVRGALAAVASGNVDGGFVYRTDAAIEDRVAVVYEVPRAEGPEILYPLAILEGRARPETRALFDFLRSEPAADLFRSYGFVVLDETR